MTKDMTTLLPKYLNAQSIKWFPINLDVKTVDGKMKKLLLNYDETGRKPTTNDFDILADSELKVRQKYSYPYIAIDTRQTQHLDVDSTEADETIECTRMKEKLPYFLH